MYYADMTTKTPRPEKTFAPNNIAALRRGKKISMEKLGLRLRNPVTKSTIQKLEERSMGLTLDYMLQIAEVLDCAVVDLIVPERGVKVGQLDNGMMLPLLGRVAAGNWREAIHDPQGSVWVPSGVVSEGGFALRPDGDSMDLIVPDKPSAFIVIDPNQREMLNGKIYVVENGDGEATFKRYRANPASLLPVSTNPIHQPIMIGDAPFKTIGRVVYAGTEL